MVGFYQRNPEASNPQGWLISILLTHWQQVVIYKATLSCLLLPLGSGDLPNEVMQTLIKNLQMAFHVDSSTHEDVLVQLNQVRC